MPNRVLNIYLYPKADQLMLQLTYIRPTDTLVTEKRGFTFTQVVEHQMDDIGQELEYYWSKLNYFDFFDNEFVGIDVKYHVKTYLYDSQFNNMATSDHEQWLADQGRLTYFYEEMFIVLPQTEELPLLKLLIGLDPLMRDFIPLLEKNNVMHVNYHFTAPPDIPNIQNYIRQVIREPGSEVGNKTLEDKLCFSRRVATWMLTKLSDSQMISTLSQLLTTNQKTLTQVIRERIYPASPIHYFILANCTFYKDDKAMPALLNPNIPYNKALLILKNQLRTQPCELSTKSWFWRYAKMRQSLWQVLVDTAVGKTVDQGIYSKIYTEMKLLKESSFSLSADGHMQLHYGDTPAYQRYYDTGKEFSDVLEVELTRLCALLELHFLPGQDFYAGSVKFDQPTTTYLKNCGFHLTEAECLLLEQDHHQFSLFKPEVKADVEEKPNEAPDFSFQDVTL